MKVPCVVTVGTVPGLRATTVADAAVDCQAEHKVKTDDVRNCWFCVCDRSAGAAGW